MYTRRDVLIHGIALGVGLLAGTKAVAAYTPPNASADRLTGVQFDTAQAAGVKYLERFDRWDAQERAREAEGAKQHKKVGIDPNTCRALLDLTGKDGKTALFWDSKMAVDADGASDEHRRGSSGSNRRTSLSFSDKKSFLDAAVVPYVVVPTIDKRPDGALLFPKGPWLDTGDAFTKDLRLQWGNLAVVILGNNIAGAIFGDEGPAMKIGEASIAVHEKLRAPPAPWEDATKSRIRDVSQSGPVLTILMRDTFFDINKFGPANQAAMGKAIHAEALNAFDRFRGV